jgi:hypothetical protein
MAGDFGHGPVNSPGPLNSYLDVVPSKALYQPATSLVLAT